jgi:DNA-directed RNA polymerase subunit M/transcription elongation factor TFIIS
MLLSGGNRRTVPIEAPWRERSSMATTITTTCPHCKKAIKIPVEVVGKKIKCKNCGSAFVATTTAVQSADPRAKEKAAETFKPVEDDDDGDGDGKPYDVSHLDLDPRCPHCANLMDPPDALVCLHCGYNIETRQKAATRRIKDPTGEEWFWWLLPPVVCILLFLTFLGILSYTIVGYFAFREEREAKLAETWGDLVNFGRSCNNCFWLWVAIISLWFMWLTGKFAFKRLVYHFRPPEQEIH